MNSKLAANAIAQSLKNWAGNWLSKTTLSGSHAKGTSVLGESDVDLFISLRAGTPGTLGDLYNSLYQWAEMEGWSPRRQTVSVGINYNGVAIDLVPAKIQAPYRNWHSLYNNRKSSWTQTNVAIHIQTVSTSGRTDEIRAIKIWRNLRGLDFHSFYLELTVMDSLHRLSTYRLAENVLEALNYIADYLPTARVIDPANSNNIISSSISLTQKTNIALEARRSLQALSWEEIIW
jgi:hypothetical protein